MAYKHGVYVNEVPTAITPPTTVSASLPVVFGTAAVNRSAREQVPVNEPVLCHSYEEAVAAFGYSDDWSFTLSEFMYSHFVVFGLSPVVLVNVLDPAIHKTAVSGISATVVDGLAKVMQQGILPASVVVKSDDENDTYSIEDAYTLDFDKEGHLVVQIVPGGPAAGAASLSLSFEKLDPALVDGEDIIGGIEDGKPTGLELLNQVFPRFRLIPGLVLAPGYSDIPAVAAVMSAKAGNVNGMFKTLAVTDLPADTAYENIAAWKNANGYTSERQINAYPQVQLGERAYHLSTQLAGIIGATDAAFGDIPYVSPSNQSLQATGAMLGGGSPLFLGPEQAAYLNGEGIVTALNFVGGWKAWGNRTGAYPANSDPKDSFIPVRRMMDWISNTIILSYWRYLDGPTNTRLIQAITDNLNIWLNGLVASGALLGGKVEFQAADNPATGLVDGAITFHVSATPPSPAREINFKLEYDANYLSALFG